MEDEIDIQRLGTEFDRACLGAVARAGENGGPCLIYDASKIIEILMEDPDMTEEEAWEHYYFNIEGAYVGPGTPAFLHSMEPYSSVDEFIGDTLMQ